MAIQLSDRDYLIFKLLAEHNVLLEKHIAWFIAAEEKPVLIRDRLRKLFYLDYLLCQRYDNRLPWWSTPTKPLIYMLAPLARTMSGDKNGGSEITDADKQKYLEIANIRMIFLIAQKDGLLQNFQWQSASAADGQHKSFDAVISCSGQSVSHRIGLVSHPELNDSLVALLEQSMNDQSITRAMVICRDQEHLQDIQKLMRQSLSIPQTNNLIFAVHQNLYKSGLNKTVWLNLAGEKIDFHSDGSMSLPITKNSGLTTNFQPAA